MVRALRRNSIVNPGPGRRTAFDPKSGSGRSHRIGPVKLRSRKPHERKAGEPRKCAACGAMYQALSFFFGTNDTTLRVDRPCRFFDARRMALTSKLYLAARSSRTRRTSSTMGSLSINLFSHEFFRCADDRAVIPMLPTDQGKCPGIGRVRNVHAIPSHQKIHSMHRCNRDMGRVRSGLARDFAGRQDAGG